MTQDASLSGLYDALAPNIKGKLKNKVYDYATSDDATLTVPDPLSPYKKDTMEMTPLQWMSTYDDEFKKSNPQYAALNAYYHPFQSNRSLGYALGNNLNKLYQGYGPMIGNILDKGPLAGGLLSAAPGLMLGALGTGALNLFTGRSLTSDLLRNALIGGLATGSLGAYSGYLRKYKPNFEAAEPPEKWTPQELKKIQEATRLKARTGVYKSGFVKAAAMGAAEAQSRVVQLIQSAPGLSFTEKSQLIAGISQLSSNEVSQLSNSLAGIGGAAVGAIVARFLMNKGLIGTVLGAIFGGTVARSLFGPPIPRNDLGQPSFQGRTLLGQYL